MDSNDTISSFEVTKLEEAAITSNGYTIGSTGPGGGTVFRLPGNGQSGLEFAPHVIGGYVPWGCSGTDTPVTNLSGFDNTQDIPSGALNELLLDFADCWTDAGVAAMYYQGPAVGAIIAVDWYLPSILELDELHNAGITKTVEMRGELTDYSKVYADGSDVNVTSLPLWSSTEHTEIKVWGMRPTGEPTPADKSTGKDTAFSEATFTNTSYGVLPIRSFN